MQNSEEKKPVFISPTSDGLKIHLSQQARKKRKKAAQV